MGALTDLWNTVSNGAEQGIGAGLGGALGSQIGYGLGELTGYNDAMDKRQIRQQQKLTAIQQAANSALMKQSYGEQFDLWNKTNYKATMAHMKNAGLNPALLYAKGSTGGSTGGGSAAVSGGSASNSAEQQMAVNQQTSNGMALMKIASEVKLNEALANKANADATLPPKQGGLIEAETSKISTEIDNIKTDTALKSEQTNLNKLLQNSTEISNSFNSENNKTLLNSNIQILKELTAKANVAESTQNSLIELAKNQVRLTASQTLLNNSSVKLQEADIQLINSKIEEICNNISVSQGQLKLNASGQAQQMEIEKMNLSNGFITKEARGLLLTIWNAFTGRTDYKYGE